MLDAVLLMQPRATRLGSSGSPATSSDKIVAGLAAEILLGLPRELDPAEAPVGVLEQILGCCCVGSDSGSSSKGGEQGTSCEQQQRDEATGDAEGAAEANGAAAGGAGGVGQPKLDSLRVVQGQELERFRRLARVLHSSLVQVQRAIKGLVVMSGELEAMYHALLNNKVGVEAGGCNGMYFSG
jgi:hypothetical protein